MRRGLVRLTVQLTDERGRDCYVTQELDTGLRKLDPEVQLNDETDLMNAIDLLAGRVAAMVKQSVVRESFDPEARQPQGIPSRHADHVG